MFQLSVEISGLFIIAVSKHLHEPKIFSSSAEQDSHCIHAEVDMCVLAASLIIIMSLGISAVFMCPYS